MGSPLSYSGGRGRTDYRCKLRPGANGHPERDITARASRKLPPHRLFGPGVGGWEKEKDTSTP